MYCYLLIQIVILMIVPFVHPYLDIYVQHLTLYVLLSSKHYTLFAILSSILVFEIVAYNCLL